MTKEDLMEVREECERLLARIDALEKEPEFEKSKNWMISGHFNVHTGVIRRASMDLTRALARLRK